MSSKALALTALALLVVSGVIAAVPIASGTTIQDVDFARVVNASWGTPSSPSGAAPGDKDLSLTVTLQYDWPNSSVSVQGLATFPVGFTLYGSTNQSSAWTQASVSNEEVFSLTFSDISVSSSLAPGSYNLTLGVSGYLSDGIVLQQTSTISVFVESRPELQFSASTSALAAGQVDAIEIQATNVGSGSASDISLTLSVPGVSVLTPFLNIQSLAVGGSATVEGQVYVPSAASGSSLTLTITATYDDPYGIQQSVQQELGLYVSAVQGSVLNFQAGTLSLVPGSTNEVPLTLTNLGSGSLFQIHTQTSSSSQVSILTQFPTVAELGPNSSTTASIEIYIPSTLANSPLELTLATSYTTALGIAGSSTQTLGLYTENANASIPNVIVSVSPLKSELSVGTQSVVSYDVENVGAAPLDSVVLSLALSSPLVVIQNSSYALPRGVLDPGDSVVYQAVVGSSTSASPGYYSASVTVSYVDQSGTEKSATFSSGLMLTGMIELIFQSTQVSQGNTTLSVSGEILDEGFSSAYYASVGGSISGTSSTSQPDYVGEIDPNTPVPFSLTLPYTPSATAKSISVNVGVTYKDSLGVAGAYNASIPTTLSPVTSLLGSRTSTSGSSTGVDLFTYLEVAVIAVLIVVGVAGYVYVRRNRAQTYPTETQEKPDQGVI